MNLVEKKYCTGCGLCKALCREKAISMIYDELTGFAYPVIDKERCTNCGLCMLNCPMTHKEFENQNHHPKVYAAIAKDEEVRGASTSGGMFMLLATEVLRNDGVVVGTAYRYDENRWGWSCDQTLIDSIDQLESLVRSKYMQSKMDGIYEAIRNAALTGKEILFCGLPCQVDAVKKYSNLSEIKNLIFVDLLCRGVPSPKAHGLYVRQIEKEQGKKVVAIKAKDKTYGWHSIGFKYIFDDGTFFVEKGSESAFVSSFAEKNYCVRDSCFSCIYKKERRASDVTIGDFWGMEDPYWDDDKGTSALFINTAQGEAMFHRIEGKIRYKEFPFKAVEQGNAMAFTALPDCEKKRIEFWTILQDNDYRMTMKMIEKQ